MPISIALEYRLLIISASLNTIICLRFFSISLYSKSSIAVLREKFIVFVFEVCTENPKILIGFFLSTLNEIF